jgi:hypothetical protein
LASQPNKYCSDFPQNEEKKTVFNLRHSEKKPCSLATVNKLKECFYDTSEEIYNVVKPYGSICCRKSNSRDALLQGKIASRQETKIKQKLDTTEKKHKTCSISGVLTLVICRFSKNVIN